jgi:acetylglutamate kinase
LLDLLTGHGYLPVVACVGGDRTGRIYNVNADQMAVACATAWRADCIVFLTDVEGVRGRDGGIVSRLTAAAARELISEGIATGGMQAKLSAAEKALEGGAGTVIIAPGSTPGVMERLLAGEALGTRMLVSAGQEVPAGD